MKKGLIYWMLAVGCLVGCISTEEPVPGTPDNVPSGSALLKVSGSKFLYSRYSYYLCPPYS